ncbi:MAG TPA: hypothetical protein VMX55_02340 [candidate division Zixibacteria bacterium]|nr:hypothetical protein [candidate division Zixibacteria bacterium]
MSEDKDNYDETPVWDEAEESKKEKEELQTETTYSFSTIPATEEPSIIKEQDLDITEEALRKKRRRTILIIIFAIVLPIIAAAVGLGFLIWGLVVGFTTCFNNCTDSCNNCCNCCDYCNSTCTGCCNTCDNCGNCCGSSSSVEQNGIQTMTSTIKDSFKAAVGMIKWYYYYVKQYIGEIFFK